jgi:hypothetical protein
MKEYTSFKALESEADPDQILRVWNTTARARAASLARGKEDRAVLRAFKSGELSFGGSRVDLTAAAAQKQ